MNTFFFIFFIANVASADDIFHTEAWFDNPCEMAFKGWGNPPTNLKVCKKIIDTDLGENPKMLPQALSVCLAEYTGTNGNKVVRFEGRGKFLGSQNVTDIIIFLSEKFEEDSEKIYYIHKSKSHHSNNPNQDTGGGGEEFLYNKKDQTVSYKVLGEDGWIFSNYFAVQAFKLACEENITPVSNP